MAGDPRPSTAPGDAGAGSPEPDAAATVAHELRTPLTAIRSLAEILRDHPEVPAEEREELLALVIAESERLTRLVEQVLDLSVIEAGAAEWRTTAVGVGHVVTHAVRVTAPVAQASRVEVRVDVPDPPPAVRADADRLIQVLVNLLSNAAAACPADGTGRVAVRAASDGDVVRVEVRDNGPGVDPADAERIFERYGRGAADGARPSGTGLGLAISRRIAEELGGRLGCRTDVADGGVFVLELPAAADAGAPPTRPRDPDAGGRP